MSGKTNLFLILPLLIFVIGFTSSVDGQIVNPITVTTDKSLYYEGQTIVISGEVSEILYGYAVSLLITGPNGDTVSIDQLKVDSNKRFSTSETAGGSLYDEAGSGTYTVSVLYATANRTAETTFQYISSDTTQPENSIDAHTNKSFYKNGDRVIVSGTIRDYVAVLHSNTALTYRVYDPEGNGVTIGSVLPNSDGSFSFNFIAGGSLYKVSGYYPIQLFFGAIKGETIMLYTSEEFDIPEPPFKKELLKGDEYIPIRYSFDFTKRPLIGISFGEHDIEQSQLVESSVKTGIEMWTVPLEQKFGGDWSVDYVIITPQNRLQVKPDIIFTLTTKIESPVLCGERTAFTLNPGDYDFANEIVKAYRPANIGHCYDLEFLKNPELVLSLLPPSFAQTDAHEFFHALGFMHTYNKELDFMCGGAGKYATCPSPNSEGYSLEEYDKSRVISDFDLTAIAYLYGIDGFQNPNKAIFIDSKFTADDYLNFDPSTYVITPAPTRLTPSQPNTVIPDWVKNVASFWCEEKIHSLSFILSIQYLMDNKIIIPTTKLYDPNPQASPDWVKVLACSWSEGQITDKAFGQGFQYLILKGILKVN